VLTSAQIISATLIRVKADGPSPSVQYLIPREWVDDVQKVISEGALVSHALPVAAATADEG
jgi:hypothetical protein